jgi:hypothetical protein
MFLLSSIVNYFYFILQMLDELMFSAVAENIVKAASVISPLMAPPKRHRNDSPENQTDSKSLLQSNRDMKKSQQIPRLAPSKHTTSISITSTANERKNIRQGHNYLM